MKTSLESHVHEAVTDIETVTVPQISWPPKSPKDALLSSPNGRKRFEELQRRRQALASPLKRPVAATPTSQSKANRLLADGMGDNEEEEEDEEVLQLKLAAIEARLKLKQLQKSRGKPSDDDDALPRPASARSQDPTSRLGAMSPPPPRSKSQLDDVQVPLSPTRRPVAPTEPASPRRVVLGIDKGLKGHDISLKRPSSAKAGSRPTSRFGARDGAASRTGSDLGSRPQSASIDSVKRPKSFSERIAESRNVEKARMERSERAERIQANRSFGFQFDKAEVESFKAAAAETRTDAPPKSPTRSRPAESFSRDDVLRSYNGLQPSGRKRSQTAPSRENAIAKETGPYLHRRSNKSEIESPRPHSSQDTTADEETALEKTPDSSKFEPYSKLHLSNRILPHSFLTRNLSNKKVLRIPDLLRIIKAPDFQLPEDIDSDWVVFGIVASKSEPKEIKGTVPVTKDADPFDDGLNNTKRYMAITLTDLTWSIDLFLFDTAFPRYYRLSEGALIAILNPNIMPPPKGKIDTNRFSLSITSSDDKVLEIGFAKDIAYCKAVKKDGNPCQSWVDGRKTEFCDFHVDLQVRRTQAGRMGVNNGSGMLGPGGRSGQRTGFFGGSKRPNNNQNGLKPDGARYDWGSQSVYYVAPGRKTGAGGGGGSFYPGPVGQSTARLIDADDEDPFIAAGMMGRGSESKEERLRKRLANQQRERDIAQKLITNNDGGVGAEYLRARTDTPDKNQENLKPSTPSTSSAAATLGLTGFRKASTVKLSPLKRANDKPHGSGVKKTRFITTKGIKEAGRDSLAGASDALAKASNNDEDDEDDDELDIV